MPRSFWKVCSSLFATAVYRPIDSDKKSTGRDAAIIQRLAGSPPDDEDWVPCSSRKDQLIAFIGERLDHGLSYYHFVEPDIDSDETLRLLELLMGIIQHTVADHNQIYHPPHLLRTENSLPLPKISPRC